MKKMTEWEKGKGKVKMFAHGATIWYSASPNISHVIGHIVIVHELGHIVLHAKRNSKTFLREMPSPTTEQMEHEATHFAKSMLIKLANKFKDSTFTKDITISVDEITETIKEIQNGMRINFK